MSLHAASRSGYGTATRVMGTPRAVEYQVFSQVTGQLTRALRDGGDFAALAAALHENRMLWTALAADLAQPGNALPEGLKAQLLGLALFTRTHTAKVLRQEATAGVLVEINTAIMRGLRGQPVPADAPGPLFAAVATPGTER